MYRNNGRVLETNDLIPSLLMQENDQHNGMKQAKKNNNDVQTENQYTHDFYT